MEPDMFGFVFSIIVILIIIALYGVPVVMIIRKAGYSGWWAILAFIPLVNIIMLWVFALSRWPVEGRGGA